MKMRTVLILEGKGLKKENKNAGGKKWRYVGGMLRDCYRAYPAFIIVEVAASVISVVVSAAGPLVLAHILELAAQGTGDRREQLLGSILIYGGISVFSVILSMIRNRVFAVAGIYGEKYFGDRKSVV